jgi:peptide/nickel transport system substrate-binding protein
MCTIGVFVMLVAANAVINPIRIAEAAPPQTTLTIGSLQFLSTLNPFMAYREEDRFFTNLVYDSLTATDQDMNVTPNLALSWNIVPARLPYGSVWQYNLTHNAVWHDGEPMDANDVNFTFNYQVGLNYSYIWLNQPYTHFIDCAEKMDNYTVWIHFKDANGDPAPCIFGDKVMMPILPEHIWSGMTAEDASFEFENPWPIGTGPFKCTANTASEFNGRSALVLLKNENYHAKADFGREIRFDSLVLNFYLEPAAMRVDMETGAIDVAQFNAPSYESLLDYITSHPSAPIGTHAGMTCTSESICIEVNMKSDAPAPNRLRLDPAVRTAMAHSVDKTFIKDNLYKGFAQVGSAMLGPIFGDLYWEPGSAEDYEFDLAVANQSLDAAGYTWNTEHTVRMSASDNPYMPKWPLSFNIVIEHGQVEDKDTADHLKYDWAKIGIELNSVAYFTDEWNAMVYGYVYDLAISHWSGDPDPNHLLFRQSSHAIGGWSENAYGNPDYDENYTRSVETLDIAGRMPHIINCQKLVYRDAGLIVTVYPHARCAWRTDHYSGWGDWSSHPGRSIDARWGPNPLFFDLVPNIPSNTPPTASFTVVPATGDTGTMFEFDASECSDPEDLPTDLEVRWDWNNDGMWDTAWSTSKMAMRMFATAGIYAVSLSVRDTGGLTDNATIEVVVTELVIPEFGTLPLVVLALLVAVVLARDGRRRKAL